MRELDEEIREIKKEIIESRGLTIRTNNLTNSLGADIKSIAKRQAGYERRFNWNSWIAYILFATLAFVGLWLATNYRIQGIEEDRQRLEEEVESLRRDVANKTQQLNDKREAERSAMEFYRLVRARERAEVVERWSSLRNAPLSRAEAAFFGDTVDQFKQDLSIEAYHRGLNFMRTGQYTEAEAAFSESMRLADTASHIPAVKLNYARALMQLDRLGNALEYAQTVAQGRSDRTLQPEATLLCAEIEERRHNLDAARDWLRGYLRRWPNSARVASVRRHLSELNRRAMRSRRGGSSQPQ